MKPGRASIATDEPRTVIEAILDVVDEVRT
jgi:hypothetical protein